MRRRRRCPQRPRDRRRHGHGRHERRHLRRRLRSRRRRSRQRRRQGRPLPVSPRRSVQAIRAYCRGRGRRCCIRLDLLAPESLILSLFPKCLIGTADVFLFHADDVTLLDSTAHAVIPFGYVHRAPVVPAGTHTPVAVRIPPEEGPAAEAADGAVVEVLAGHVAAHGALARGRHRRRRRG